MSIEALTAVAVKEVAVTAAKEAAVQTAREIAQKMATEAVRPSGGELQNAMMERQSMQDGFRVGEMSEAKGEGREVAKKLESDAAEELRGKLDAEDASRDAATGHELSETSSVEAQQSAEARKAMESVETESVAETENVPEVEETKPIQYDLQTRNQGLKDDVHPITGVPFEERTVADAEGNEVTGVFAKFESYYDAQLPKDLLKSSDKVQFAECNRQLNDAIGGDPDVAKKFSTEQLEQVRNGDTPDGYTWHHSEECGKMQLVKSDVHAQTGHTGGRSIWGGGSEFRV